MQSTTKSDVLGRALGVLILLAGVGMLGFVFWKAYGLFQTPAGDALGLRFTGDPKRDPGGAQIGAQFGVLLFRMGYLFLMSLAGSLLAQKGINLYFSALHGATVAEKRGTETHAPESLPPMPQAEKSAQV